MEKTKVFVLTTGGTIEKTYDEVEGSIGNREPVIKKRVLDRIRLPHTQVELKYLMNKDSLEMDDQDRLIIHNAIEEFSKYGSPIIVIHGTDTMTESGEYCLKKNPNPRVPIIFTGAMKPLGFDDSDAEQNVVEALLAAKLLRPGYYVSFHNHLFTIPNVRKNKKLRTFEALK